LIGLVKVVPKVNSIFLHPLKRYDKSTLLFSNVVFPKKLITLLIVNPSFPEYVYLWEFPNNLNVLDPVGIQLFPESYNKHEKQNHLQY
jgi:hypothetical protein